METTSQDSALADLSERQFQHQIDSKAVYDWLAIREIERSGNISFQNWQDARRRNNKEQFNSGEMAAMEDSDMKINSPETHYHYPTPEKPKMGSLAKSLLGLAAATVLGGSGVGAAYFVAEALKSRPVLQGTDTDTTIIQRFVEQDADWIKP